MSDWRLIRQKYVALKEVMDERSRRVWAATETKAVGRGGFSVVLRATGMSSKTLARGLKELEVGQTLPAGRVRRPGGGRKPAKVLFVGLPETLEKLVEPVTRGDPESPLRWTCKSTRRLALELAEHGFDVSHTLVAQLLREVGYSLQANRKTREGTSHPDRNAQFEHINRAVRQQLRHGQPAVSVDTKKKELVGDFRNAGREWRPKGRPEEVRVHDFLDKQKGKAIPYGVYDMGRNMGWVSVGIDHDTATFAVATIRRWWRHMGRQSYPKARSLLITADSGGSNGNRVRLWKWELQRLANATGLTIHVSHLPPGTSKWNKIEHRLFAFITQNWRGQPLLTHATIVNLIASTQTKTGLKVRCELDPGQYPSKRAVTDQQMKEIRLKPNRFHGEWNYTIQPGRK
jgi:Rhodopirellula transposase DDE domain